MATATREYRPEDFRYGPVLGEGRFGTVIYAERRARNSTNRFDGDGATNKGTASHVQPPSPSTRQQRQRQGYAIKMIPKSEVLRHNQLQAVMTEKHILCEVLSSTSSESDQRTDSNLFMKLFSCFHDASNLYFVLELCAGGTLHDLIESRRLANAPFDSVLEFSWVQYYAARVLQAIECLHRKGVVHRDISPQNIGLTFPKGEVKLGDFGAAAIFVRGERGSVERWAAPGTASPDEEFFGTADYVSPEMIRGNDDGVADPKAYMNFPAMDLWAFGCFIYHMIAGRSPFHAEDDRRALKKVLDYANGKRDLYFPESIPKDATVLISCLLSVDRADPLNIATRLGVQDRVIDSILSTTDKPEYVSIRDQYFFKSETGNFIWESLDIRDPPYPPLEPEWMTGLEVSALKSFDSIVFDT